MNEFELYSLGDFSSRGRQSSSKSRYLCRYHMVFATRRLIPYLKSDGIWKNTKNETKEFFVQEDNSRARLSPGVKVTKEELAKYETNFKTLTPKITIGRMVRQIVLRRSGCPYTDENTGEILILDDMTYSGRDKAYLMEGKTKRTEKEYILSRTAPLGDTAVHMHEIRLGDNYLYMNVELKPHIAPSDFVNKMKDATSIARLFNKELMKLPSMWTRDFFITTAGELSPKAIEEFIKIQSKQI